MEISPIYLHTHTSPLPIDAQEVLRYMGCNDLANDEVVTLARRAIEALKKVLSCKACYRRTEVVLSDADVVDFGFMQLRSAALYKQLEGCKTAYLFAATIGIEADRLILQYKRSAPSFALALQAAGAAAIESYCDILCNTVFEKEAADAGMHANRRFSAGYGDLAVEYQQHIFAALDCTRKIGLTLTDGYMMLPSKSVTAFVGIGDKKACIADKCSACTNSNCVFRKGSDNE